jgi:hypothetical protein
MSGILRLALLAPVIVGSVLAGRRRWLPDTRNRLR